MTKLIRPGFPCPIYCQGSSLQALKKLTYFHPVNEINIILDILNTMLKAHPASVFINSLHQQYCNRGGLSKKQLEGLYSKAAKTTGIPVHKLATLEAIIKKKPTRERSAASIRTTQPTKDMATGLLLDTLLEKYPQHKRLIFLRSKYDHNETLTSFEIAEVQRFHKLLIKN